MKKILFFVVSLFVSLSAWAEVIDTIEVDNFRYVLHDDKTASLLHYVDASLVPDSFDIPEDVLYYEDGQSYKVVELDTFSMEYLDNLVGIILPSGMRKLSYSCFSMCENLKTVQLNEGLEVLEANCFDGCVKMTEIELPSSLQEIYDMPFMGCYYLSTITCRAKTPPAVVGDYGFDMSEMSSAVKLLVPKNSVEAYTADKQWGKFPVEGITRFQYDGLEYELVDDHVLVAKNQSTDLSGAIYIPEEVYFEDDDRYYPVTGLEYYCFRNCKDVTYVELPNTITSIGTSCFLNSGLIEIYIPESVKNIDKCGFCECEQLETITLESETPPISGESLFLTIGRNPEEITLRIPDAGEKAYTSAEMWNELTIKPYVRKNGVAYDLTDDGEALVSSIQNPNIEGDVKIASEVTYKGVSYPVTTLDGYCFSECEGINSVVIPEGVTTMEIGCFSSCPNLLTVEIPNSVTTMRGNCFEHCGGLLSVKIPEGITTLHNGCFQYCFGLGSVELPSTLNTIEEDCFRDCHELKVVTSLNPTPPVCEGSKNFSRMPLVSLEGEVVNSEPIVLVVPDAAAAKYKEANVWKEMDIMTLTDAEEEPIYAKVRIGDLIYEIEDNHAYVISCVRRDSLISLTIPDSVPYLGQNYPIEGLEDISYLEDLESVKLPSGLTEMGWRSFDGCIKLKTVTIPEKVSYIGIGSFALCESLKSVTCLNPTPAELGEYVFYELDLSTIKLYVPKSAVEAYKAADVWKEFNIQVISGSGVETVVADSQEGEPVIFDFQGRRVLNPRSGKLYIVNGKKMLWW